MKRLLLLVTDLEIGGTPRVVRELAVRLSREKVDVQVACLGRWGPVADEIQSAGVSVSALDARGPMDFRVFVRLSRLIQRERIDTVLSFLVHANVAAATVRCGRGFELFESIQTTQPYPRWHWLAQGIVQHAATAVIVPSESVADVAKRWSGVPKGKIRVIPNAVDADSFATIAPVRMSKPYRVGFIGRLDPIKRIPDLVNAIAELGEDYRLEIFGDGAAREDIQRQINAAKLADRARLHGAVADPREALEQMDLLVLPSAAEGFGLVLVEAMAAGRPAIATNVAGIRDVVTQGHDGLLVPPENPGELAKAIRKSTNDPGLAQSLISAGKRTVAARFAWPAVIAGYRAILGV